MFVSKRILMAKTMRKYNLKIQMLAGLQISEKATFSIYFVYTLPCFLLWILKHIPSPLPRHNLMYVFWKIISAIGFTFSTLEEIQKCFNYCTTWQKIIRNKFENNCMYLLLIYTNQHIPLT